MNGVETYQNEFLSKWIYGKLTDKEYNTFITSRHYKNLVYSMQSEKNSKTKDKP